MNARPLLNSACPAPGRIADATVVVANDGPRRFAADSETSTGRETPARATSSD